MKVLEDKIGAALIQLHADQLRDADELLLCLIGRCHKPQSGDIEKAKAATDLLAATGNKNAAKEFAIDCAAFTRAINLVSENDAMTAENDELKPKYEAICAERRELTKTGLYSGDSWREVTDRMNQIVARMERNEAIQSNNRGQFGVLAKTKRVATALARAGFEGMARKKIRPPPSELLQPAVDGVSGQATH